MKNTIILMLLGALGGIVVASYVVPPALSWYSEPGGLPDGATIQAIVQIPEVIRYSTGRLIRGQFVGAIVGSLVGLALGIMLARRSRAAKAATTASVVVLALLPAAAWAEERGLVRDVTGTVGVLARTNVNGTSLAFGGRVVFELARGVAIDAEIAFAPQDDVTPNAEKGALSGASLLYERRRVDGFAGLKIGRRGERVGVFGKVRPGVQRLTNQGVNCRGEVCALILIAVPDYRAEFALDLGGVAEFYTHEHALVRLDLGSTIIRHRSAGPGCDDCTSKNFSTALGVGLRF